MINGFAFFLHHACGSQPKRLLPNAHPFYQNQNRITKIKNQNQLQLQLQIPEFSYQNDLTEIPVLQNQNLCTKINFFFCSDQDELA